MNANGLFYLDSYNALNGIRGLKYQSIEGDINEELTIFVSRVDLNKTKLEILSVATRKELFD